MKIDTSFETPDYSKMEVAAPSSPSKGKKTPTKKVFPEVTLRDCPDLAAAIKAGEKFKATVEFVPTRIEAAKGGTQPYYGSDEGCCSVTLEITSIDVDAKAPAAKLETAGDAMQKWFKKKK